MRREYKSPRKRFCRQRQHLATLATPTILRPASFEFHDGRRSYFVNDRRFTEFFDRYFHIPTIVMKHELGLPFPPRNLRIKFGANPSTIFLVIVVIDRHTERDTHKPTPGKTHSLAFAGIITCWSFQPHLVCSASVAVWQLEKCAVV